MPGNWTAWAASLEVVHRARVNDETSPEEVAADQGHYEGGCRRRRVTKTEKVAADRGHYGSETFTFCDNEGITEEVAADDGHCGG